MLTNDEYESIFYCSICKLKKPYHEDIFELNEVMVCDDCNTESIFQESCKQCDRYFSFIEIEFLIHKFNKVNECVQCLSQDKDKKIELSYYNFKYLNKNIEKNTNEKYEYKFKYEQLNNNVTNLLNILNCKTLEEIKKTFLLQKDDITEFNNFMADNNLSNYYEIVDIIQERNKYNNIKKILKDNDIEENKFLNFLEKYKNNSKNINLVKIDKSIITNIEDQSIRLYDNPIVKYDLLDVDYKHFKNKLNLYKLYKRKEKFKNDNIIKINKKLPEINVFDLKKNVNELNIKYNNISKRLDELEKDFIEFQKVEPIFNKIKNNTEYLDIFEKKDNELNILFSKLKNDKINEYKTMKEIGKKIIEQNIDDVYLKEKLNIYNDRNDRIILKSKRIYLLSKYIDIETIALSRVSHFIRDSHNNTFNCLLNVLKINPVSINSLFI